MSHPRLLTVEDRCGFFLGQRGEEPDPVRPEDYDYVGDDYD